MLKVVIDARMINTSGIGTYLQNMILCLTDNFKLILLGKKKVLDAFEWSNGIEILEASSDIYSVMEQIELPFKIPACDVFISPHYNIPLFPVKAKKRIAFITDVYHLAFYKTLSLLQKLYAKFMISKAINLSDKIITISEFSRSEILKYTNVSSEKIKIVYFGTDADDFFKNQSDKNFSAVKSRYNLPDKYFLFVGNIKPHKNLKNLLLAFEILLKQNKEFKLVIVGKKEGLITVDTEISDLIEKKEELKKNIIFTGYVENQDIPAIYKNAFALVFPSFYEGFGLPPLEAMIADCPVISSNAASLPEACGDAALYIDPFNIADIAEKMQFLISNPELRRELVEKGRKNYKRFDRDNFSRKLYDVITNTVKE